MAVRLDDVRLLARIAEREGLLADLVPLWRRCPEPLASLVPGAVLATGVDWIWPVLEHLAGRAASDTDCARALVILDALFRPTVMEVAARRGMGGHSGTAGVIETLADTTEAPDYAVHLVHLLIAANRPNDVNRAIQRYVSDGRLAVSTLVESEKLDGLLWQAPAPETRRTTSVPVLGADGDERVERRLDWPSGRPYLAELQGVTLEANFLLHVPEAGVVADGISYRRRYGLRYRSFLMSPKQPVVVHAPLTEDVPILERATYFGRPSEHGHFIVEGLERLYAHTMAGHPPRAPILVQSLPRPGYRRLLAGLGLPADDDGYVVVPDNRVHCRRLTVAGIGTQLPAVHPDTVRFLGDRGRRAAGVPAGRDGAGRRLYLARRASGRRGMLNEASVRGELETAGYETVYLEDLELVDQIALIADASEVVGIHGSAMINLIWARPGTRICVLAPASWRTWAPGHVDMLFGLFEAVGLEATLVECDFAETARGKRQQFDADLEVPIAGIRRWLGRSRSG
ncbi:glycosyltransferase family 61 protein [Thalassobaculum sp.]|uniref:glycosyltransferase family 61 protein n=1 Tax=Thalassobaculum sp. TaxID=2022740 RepID=UPI0032EC3CC4